MSLRKFAFFVFFFVHSVLWLCLHNESAAEEECIQFHKLPAATPSVLVAFEGVR